jgi:aminomethyltransferase
VSDAVDAELHALRTSATVADADHVACVRIRGTGAQDLLERVSPRTLFARPGKMVHTVFLDDAAMPIADVYLCCDEDDFLVFADGMPAAAAIDYLTPHARGLDAAFEDLAPTHALLCLGGPYAWEVLAELATPDVIGLPYLNFFHEARFVCFRGGKTGEYGYDLLIERDRLDAVRDQLATVGRRFDLRTISLPALEAAALENFFWNPRRDVRAGLTPIELQLQWRVTYGRTFPGADALAARRQDASRRSVLIVSEAELADDAPVTAGDRTIGTILHAGRSPTRGDWIAVAVVERRYAHAGLVGLASNGALVRTLSAPAIDNRSLYIDPQRHSYASRETDRFPPLVRA